MLKDLKSNIEKENFLKEIAKETNTNFKYSCIIIGNYEITYIQKHKIITAGLINKYNYINSYTILLNGRLEKTKIREHNLKEKIIKLIDYCKEQFNIENNLTILKYKERF
jgi:hypothetical protein